MVAASATPVAPYERNVLLQGQTPSNFLLKKLVSLPPSHLDQAMLLLPFTMLPQFLEFAIDWIKKVSLFFYFYYSLSLTLIIFIKNKKK